MDYVSIVVVLALLCAALFITWLADSEQGVPEEQDDLGDWFRH